MTIRLPEHARYFVDLNGNRLTTNGGDPNTIAHNRLANDGTYSYTYDLEGNLTSRTDLATFVQTVYQYDYRNRLTHVQWSRDYDSPTRGTAVWSIEYVYDPFDRLIERKGDMFLDLATSLGDYVGEEYVEWLVHSDVVRMTQWREIRYYDGDRVVFDQTSISCTNTPTHRNSSRAHASQFARR